MDTQKFICEKCGGNHPTEAHAHDSERSPEDSREKVESAYFIRKDSLEQTLERLKEIEPSKRKIIIHVGVHPHEGTDMLIAKYASAWAEKYGATVVCQPAEETSHAVWAKRKTETNGDATLPLPPDTILDEEDYADKFSFDNKDTFIIQFHGTPLRAYREGKSNRTRGLDIETSRYADHPEDFQNRRHAILFRNPKITEGLEEVLTDSSDQEVENHVGEEKHQDDHRWYPNGPNILLIEYFYEGKPVQVEDPYFQALLKEETKAEEAGGVGPLSTENWHRQMNIGPSYLEQDVLSDKDIEIFHTVLVKDFEKILRHISSRLPDTPTPK